MRWRDIVSGILLILSIIDLALAAPVLVQEERQADVYVVQIPKDVITVLGKRAGNEELKLAEDYFRTTFGSLHSPASSSSSSTKPIPPEFSSESTNVVESSEKNPTSSTANPYPVLEPSQQLDVPTSKEHSSVVEASTNLPPKKRPWTDPDPDFDREHRTKSPEKNPTSSTANPYTVLESSQHLDLPTSKEPSSVTEAPTVLPPKKRPRTFMDSDLDRIYRTKSVKVPNFDLEHWTNVEGPPSLKPEAPRPLSSRPSEAGPSNPGSSNTRPL